MGQTVSIFFFNFGSELYILDTSLFGLFGSQVGVGVRIQVCLCITTFETHGASSY